MDLHTKAMLDARSKVKVTVLTRKDGIPWTPRELGHVGSGTADIVEMRPDLPNILLVHGEHSNKLIAASLGHNEFELRVVTGLDDPSLPFKTDFI